MPRGQTDCGALLLYIADEIHRKVLSSQTFFGQICQGVILVKFIDIFAIWSIIDSV